jgi:predicted nucleotidyltransferase
VALYGGLVKGRFTPGISDLNVLVVVRDAEFRLRQRAVERGADVDALWGGVLRSLPKGRHFC